MPGRGIPTTLDGCKTRLRVLPQYAHLSEEELTDLARQKFEAETKPQPGGKFPKVVDLDDLAATDPRFKRKFTKAWRQIYKDIEGLPPAIRERLAKQTAMAFMLSERKMVDDWNSGRIGDGATALNNLNQMAMRLVGELQQTPKSRPKDRGKDETLASILDAGNKAKDLKERSLQMEAEDEAFLNNGQTNSGSPEGPPE